MDVAIFGGGAAVERNWRSKIATTGSSVYYSRYNRNNSFDSANIRRTSGFGVHICRKWSKIDFFFIWQPYNRVWRILEVTFGTLHEVCSQPKEQSYHSDQWVSCTWRERYLSDVKIIGESTVKILLDQSWLLPRTRCFENISKYSRSATPLSVKRNVFLDFKVWCNNAQSTE